VNSFSLCGKAVGGRLKEARKRCNWRFSDLSKAIGKPVGSIGSCETSGHGNGVREALIGFLQINRDWLRTGQGEMFAVDFAMVPKGNGMGQRRNSTKKRALPLPATSRRENGSEAPQGPVRGSSGAGIGTHIEGLTITLVSLRGFFDSIADICARAAQAVDELRAAMAEEGKAA
jgi:hypothetical protein